MANLRPVGIFGTGHYAPERVMRNAEFETYLDTSDEWIRQRTGVEQRHIAADDEWVSDLAIAAAKPAMEAAEWSPADIDLICIGTCMPDYFFPNSAQRAAGLLGCPESTGGIDVLSACSSYVYGVNMVIGQIASGQIDRAIVVGSEKMSAFMDWNDRSSAIIFGDGAGAVALGVAENGGDFLASTLGARYDRDSLFVPAGGSAKPHDPDPMQHKLRMQGRAIYKFAVNKLSDETRTVVAKAGLTLADIDWLIPHQVNLRIIESAIQKLDFPREKTVINIQNYGNTSSASVPIALDEAVRDGRIQRGHIVVVCAFGAGLSWGSHVFRY